MWRVFTYSSYVWKRGASTALCALTGVYSCPCMTRGGSSGLWGLKTDISDQYLAPLVLSGTKRQWLQIIISPLIIPSVYVHKMHSREQILPFRTHPPTLALISYVVVPLVRKNGRVTLRRSSSTLLLNIEGGSESLSLFIFLSRSDSKDSTNSTAGAYRPSWA